VTHIFLVRITGHFVINNLTNHSKSSKATTDFGQRNEISRTKIR